MGDADVDADAMATMGLCQRAASEFRYRQAGFVHARNYVSCTFYAFA